MPTPAPQIITAQPGVTVAMHVSTVTLRLPDGSTGDFFAGTIVGRTWDCGIVVEHPQVSEVHALISLREGRLVLIALAGNKLQIDGVSHERVALKAGMVIELVKDVSIAVLDVSLADVSLALVGVADQPFELSRPYYSVTGGGSDPPRVVPGLTLDALAHLWIAGDSWFAKVAGGSAAVLEAGTSLTIGDRTLDVVEVPRHGIPATQRAPGPLPNRVVLLPHTTELHYGSRVVVLTGARAEVIWVLSYLDTNTTSADVCRELWPGKEELATKRKRFKQLMFTLRQQLAAEHVSTELVGHSAGAYWLHPAVRAALVNRRRT